jgi:hypothetical protein
MDVNPTSGDIIVFSAKGPGTYKIKVKGTLTDQVS